MKTTLFVVFIIVFTFGCSKDKSVADRTDSILNLLKTSQVTVNGTIYNSDFDTVVNSNPGSTSPNTIKLASLSTEDIQKIHELVSQVDKETVNAFDEKIKNWINLWAGKPTWYSDPAHVLCTDSKEYAAFVDFCAEKEKTVFPLLFELLAKADNSAHFYFLSYPVVADILPKEPLYRKYLDQSIVSYKANEKNSGNDGNSEIVLGFVHNVLKSEF